jgi:hypothetical protein
LRFPPRFSLCLKVIPDDATRGAVPVIIANAACERTLPTSPTSPRILAAISGPMPGRPVRVVPDSVSTSAIWTLVSATAVRIRGQDHKVGVGDVVAVQVRRRRRNADRWVGRVEDWIYLGRLTYVSEYGLGVSIASSSTERVPWG